MKRCYRCKKLLSLSEFTINNRAADGRRGHCKPCSQKYSRAYLKDNPWVTSYRAAKSRCTNPKDKAYKYYGGKGIKFQISMWGLKILWFDANAQDMQKPSLDRLDSTKNYSLCNCQFIEHRDNVIKSNRMRYKKG